ncbi:MAG: N-acetylmuramoyl-L-alanine amidase [Clostridiales bacterium]|jgi:N-acetylmuramoyl-L-alanine amidase|nr:N-acetylmuramoyl-L-alanine amidase [Clostridiales bacterium]
MLRFGLITFILFGIGVLLLLFVNTSSSSASDVSEYGIRERNLITAFPTRAVSESQNTLDSPENVPKKVLKKESPSVVYKVAIDAGHQSKGNYEKEPIGPGATQTKAKVSSGTQGVSTGVPEYKLTLTIAKKVKKELSNRGYEVIMIRNSHDVNLSNRERAEIANESDADIFIRIHADGSTNPKANGASTLYPSKDNPYVSSISKESKLLSEKIVDSLCKTTGAKNRGAIARDDMSGINWSKLPVSIIEMGFMTNEKEDKLMQKKSYQNKIVAGICDGIDEYFKELEQIERKSNSE